MPRTVRELRGRGTSAVESRYKATASEDVTVETNVCVCVCVCACECACVCIRERDSEVTRYIKESNKSDHQSETRQ
jgi:hypothetical protein